MQEVTVPRHTPRAADTAPAHPRHAVQRGARAARVRGHRRLAPKFWERDLLPLGPGEGLINDVVVTPGGEVVALTAAARAGPEAVATVLALAHGAPLWELDVAVTDDASAPSARRWLVMRAYFVNPLAERRGRCHANRARRRFGRRPRS